ncbi:uncharacterized protein LOC129950311 [Eupeodes corollae]|uniref:uncharacterized protein LOC129950311 n=1 Tax=Eupeodes corollae TaxID=290404 RepID=UPI00248FFD2A|nr:uncharacterized protein LOC129950311 [Eupeodes corollae]
MFVCVSPHTTNTTTNIHFGTIVQERRMSKREAQVVALMAIYLCEKNKNKTKNNKRLWMKDWLQKRYIRSHVNLLRELEVTSHEDLKNFLRMEAKTYRELLYKVTPLIIKKDTVMRDAITPDERLSATLRFLATGQSYEDLKFLTNISAQCLGKIIIETCEAIISELKDFIKMPNNAQEWKEVASDFENKWNFNHCIGALDGKHVNIVKPTKSGSYYFNYKKQFSIVMMALVNANYEFLGIEVGINGRASDSGVFGQSQLKYNYDEGLLNLPEPEKLPLSDDVLPYVIVGDDAFPLLENLMKPYSRHHLTKQERIFNYRLSRARRIVENAFGILANRFRVLHTTINLAPDKAAIITLACCYLHNFLIKKNLCYLNKYEYNETNCSTDDKSAILTDLQPINSGNITVNAANIRHKFCSYFNTIGSVDWQDKYV